MQRRLIPTLCFLLCFLSVQGQSTYNSISRDTIISITGTFSSYYLLDGKKLSLPVMQWFMADHPDAYSQIKVANVTDQLSLAGYTAGGVLLLSGVLLYSDSQQTSRDFYMYGGIAFASGILFQIVSNSLKKKAVTIYNEDVKKYYYQKSIGLHLGENGIELEVRF